MRFSCPFTPFHEYLNKPCNQLSSFYTWDLINNRKENRYSHFNFFIINFINKLFIITNLNFILIVNFSWIICLLTKWYELNMIKKKFRKKMQYEFIIYAYFQLIKSQQFNQHIANEKNTTVMNNEYVLKFTFIITYTEKYVNTHPVSWWWKRYYNSYCEVLHQSNSFNIACIHIDNLIISKSKDWDQTDIAHPARVGVGRVTYCGVRGLGFESPGSILTSRTETCSLSRVVRDGWDPCSICTVKWVK